MVGSYKICPFDGDLLQWNINKFIWECPTCLTFMKTLVKILELETEEQEND